jgi:hypothetical protein
VAHRANARHAQLASEPVLPGISVLLKKHTATDVANAEGIAATARGWWATLRTPTSTASGVYARVREALGLGAVARGGSAVCPPLGALALLHGDPLEGSTSDPHNLGRES